MLVIEMEKKKEDVLERPCSSKLENAMDFEFYKVLFDPVRSEIMIFLGTYGDSTITKVAEYFPQDRTVISRHLDLMYRYGILNKTKKSREYIYHLNADFVIDKFEKTTTDLKKLANKTC